MQMLGFVLIAREGAVCLIACFEKWNSGMQLVLLQKAQEAGRSAEEENMGLYTL